MSDYLTRLVERSLGLAPRIEPLIASINAPSDHMLREEVELSAASESSPAAKIETLPQDRPGVAVDAPAVETPSRTEDRLPRASSPPSESQAEIPIEEKSDDRIQPAELYPGVPSQQTPSASRPEAVEITATPPDLSPLPRTTPIVSHGMAQNVVQPEIVEPLVRAESPMESQGKTPPVIRPEIVKPQIIDRVEAAAPAEESPSLPRPAITASKKTTQPAIQPEIISPLAPAATPLLPVVESSATEPSLLPNGTTTASNKTAQPAVQPEIISPLKPAAAPFLPARATSPDEPPAIHVTIGRVEVRAIMPAPATPKAASPAAPKLSLKEYLKQRRSA